MGRRSLAALVVEAALFAPAGADALESSRRLKSPEITSRFSGMEFTDEVHWATVFEKGGLLKSFSMGKPSTRRWRVAKDELCLEQEAEGPRCYEVWVSGQRVQLRRDPAVPDEGILRKPQKQ